MTLELGPGCSISVKGFILFKRQQPARSSFIWLGGEKPQLVKGVTKQLADDDAARPVEKAEIKKAYRFGGEEVVFTPEEITSLRTFGGEGGPIVRVVGFKPLSMLPIWASTKQSTFIYPSEEDYVGSTRVFSALHQKLLEDEKMALTWFVARKNAAPVMAALVPGAEQLGSHEDQTIPPGMWIVPLPFADDIRQHPDTVLVRSPDSLVDIMRAAVETLQLPKGQYDPERYPNPGEFSVVCVFLLLSAGSCSFRWGFSLPLGEPDPTPPDLAGRESSTMALSNLASHGPRRRSA